MWFRASIILTLDVCKTSDSYFALAPFLFLFFLTYPENPTTVQGVDNFSFTSLLFIQHFSLLFQSHLSGPVFSHCPFRAAMPWSVLNKFSCIHQVRRTMMKDASIESPNV